MYMYVCIYMYMFSHTHKNPLIVKFYLAYWLLIAFLLDDYTKYSF